eukprot:TRINITY_DN67577_c0_g1_i1.p1 TRINITY_DN67577_c0_g1~~TRINITY_DN67577_c0_g1_i1.p1  ORF type:complete len:339 (-),score=59.81 TRINITY_DN67577_c0_g1_i1:390-1406(-)
MKSTKAKKYSAVDKAAVLACFKKFDANSDGEISQGELSIVLQSLGLTDFQAGRIFGVIDANNDGNIDVTEFIDWVMDAESEASEVRTRTLLLIAKLKASRDKVDSCMRNLRQAEEEAGPISPKEIWFEMADKLGMYFGEGRDKQANLVVHAEEHDVAYERGVRQGWRVVKVGHQSVAGTDYVPDLLMQVRLHSGVSVQFWTSDAIETQRKAVAKLPELRSDLEQAQADLDELERPVGRQTEAGADENVSWVRVQLRHRPLGIDRCERFDAPDGSLQVADIDSAFGTQKISRAGFVLVQGDIDDPPEEEDYDPVLVEECNGAFDGLMFGTSYIIVFMED